jgi:hypothetical protein
MDIFISPLGYRFYPPGYHSVKHLILLVVFLENFLSYVYPLGKFKIKTPSPIGFPDPTIGGLPILNGMH